MSYRANRVLRRAHDKKEGELRLLPFLVPDRPGIDIGANRGTYTYFLSKLCPSVIAYEPNPWMAAFLKKAVASNVEVRETALSNENGETQFHIPTGGQMGLKHNVGSLDNLTGQESQAIDVTLARLDDEGIEDVGFIKIDVEGHEEALLLGAEKTLKRCQPSIIIELLDLGDTPVDEHKIVRLLTDWGYEGYFYTEGSLQHLSYLTKEKIAGRNYIFLPKKA